MTSHQTLLFIDFEASSLAEHSWPIEIGLAHLTDDLEVVSEAKLNRPHPTWPENAWSPQSAAVHGVPRDTLNIADPAADVARWTLGQIRNRHLVSDAPPFDRHWLARLLETVSDYPVPAIIDFDALAFTTFTGLALDKVYEILARTHVPHRAAKDAARLAKAWRAGVKITGK